MRLAKLKIFQRRRDTQKFERVKTEIVNDIKNLPENSITVKENRCNIDKALSDLVWQDLDQKSFEFLEKTIAPLMRFQIDLNLFQAQFLYKTEKLGLAVLEGDQDEIQNIRKSIIDDIKRLPRNRSAVKEKEEYINRVLSEEFWQELDYEKCEYIKEHLSEIMKHKLLEERTILKLDLDDRIFDRKWIEFGPEGEGNYAANYKEKVEKKVLTLAETHPALKKIKNNTPISDEDLIDLEDILNGPELFISENNLRKAFN